MKIAVVGAGAIARRAHLPAWKSIPKVEVACVVDVDASQARAVALEYGVGRYTTDLASVLSDRSIDVIDVSTPTGTHRAVGGAALEAGKHVLMEKPLAHSLREAVELSESAAAVDRQLYTIFNWSFQEAPRAVRARLAEGPLGRLISIHGKSFVHLPVGWTPATWLYHADAVLYDFTPHLVDAVLGLVGSPLASISARGKNFTDHAPFLSSAQMMLTFRNGAVALLDTSWEVNHPAFTVDLYGNAGRISLDLKRDLWEESHGPTTPLHEVRSFLHKMGNIGRGILRRDISTKMLLAYRPLFEDFLSCVRGSGGPASAGRRGLLVNLVLDGARRSLDLGRPVAAEEVLSDAGASETTIRSVLHAD